MVALVFSTVLFLAASAYALWFGMKRRPAGTPLTWGEAMVAAMYVFGLMFLAYGVIPHQWLQWADKELKWRPDTFGIPLGPLGKGDGSLFKLFGNKNNVLIEDGLKFPFLSGGGRILINKQHIRDVIATVIYVVMLGFQIAVWSVWQKRGKAKAAQAGIEKASAYGRPLIKRS